MRLARKLLSSQHLHRCSDYQARSYAVFSPYIPSPSTAYEVFDEPSKARQRDRAIIRLGEQQGPDDKDRSTGLRVVDYLREEIAERLAERIEVCHCSSMEDGY